MDKSLLMRDCTSLKSKTICTLYYEGCLSRAYVRLLDTECIELVLLYKVNQFYFETFAVSEYLIIVIIGMSTRVPSFWKPLATSFLGLPAKHTLSPHRCDWFQINYCLTIMYVPKPKKSQKAGEPRLSSSCHSGTRADSAA